MSGGKTQTATQQVQIPPEVMARYKAVNTRAEAAASQPFQAYSQDPNAFVAPLTATQQAGIQNINQAAGMTQPYFNTAAGLTMSGAQGVGALTPQQIQAYQNPYTQSVVDATRAGLQQQQGQQLAQQQAEAIKAGAFGGDRAGIQRAQLMGQQGLATAQAISPLYQQAYQNAVQTAMGQQGVQAQDLQRQLAAGQQLGGLGSAYQQAALAGAQAQLGAGTVEQQTEQAGKQALYNQFLQERGYPFQVAQFLANIAMGTGALSGSTTSTTQMAPFASDEREKTNVQPLGEGMYAYDYKDDVRRAEEEGRPMPPKRVGPMAQDIEKVAPDLVSEVGGTKVVGRLERASGGVAGKGSVQAPSYGPSQSASPFAAAFQNFNSAYNAGMGGQFPQSGSSQQSAGQQSVGANTSSQGQMPAGQGGPFSQGLPMQAGFGKGGVQAPFYGPSQSAGQPAAGADASSQSQMMAGQGKMLTNQGLPAQSEIVDRLNQAMANPSSSGQGQKLAGQGAPAQGMPMQGGFGKGGVQAPSYAPQSASFSMPSMAPNYGRMSRGFGKGGVQVPSYASGGSVVAPEDMRAILAAVGQPLAFYGGKGMYGGADKGGVGAAGYVSPASIPVPKLVTAGGLPAQRASGLSEAAQTGSQIASLAQMGKSALVGSEGAGGKKGSTGLIGSEGSLNWKGYIPALGGGETGPSRAAPPAPKGADTVAETLPPAEWDTNRLFGYRGGLMRDHYAGGGALPYSTGDVGEDPLQKIGDDGDQKYEMLKPASLPQSSGSSGLGDIVNLAKTAASIYAMSDARMKDNIEQVGELYDGQPIYRYNMKGSPKTQIGLMAQDLEHNGHEDAVAGLGGLKMVDYKRATDVAAGLAPRRGYQSGGSPDIIEGPAIDFERLEAPPPPRDERKYTPEALRGLVREYGQELRARRPNFDPAFAERVFQGESGFDPRAVGDDGSSFGVPQLHMGNISPKFPRPGLGDEFMRETGLDPRDPSNSRAMTAWAMDHAAEKGWQPWTVARQLKAQGDTGGASAPGLGGGRRETAERVTPGLAGPGRGPMDPASAPFYTLTRRALGMEGEGTPTQKALTSENFWVPALAGIGSMLASRSPFLGVAVGEGLMGGTKAYTDLQGQQQQMGESRARTEQTVANISGGALQVVDGRLMVRYLRPDGSYDLVEYSKIRNLPPEERARYRVDPRDLEQAEKLLGASAGPAARAPAAAPTTEPPVAMPRGEPVSSTAPPAPPAGRMPHEAAPPASPVSRPTTVGGIGLTPEQVAQARAITQERSGFPQAEREKQPDLFTPQYELARQSENAKGQVIPLVGALAGLPRDKSPLASGPVQAIAAPIAGVVNNLASILGVSLPFDIQNPRALQEEIDKLGTRLNLQSASSAQQRAFAALQEISKGIPTYLNSPGGQAKLIPTLLVETQREIDRQNFFRSWENAAAGERGQNAEYARLSSRDANEAFEKEFTNAVAAKERAALEKMFNDRFPITDPKTGQRRNISAMEYVVEFGGAMTPEQKQRFRDRFGAGLKYDPLRYFGVN